MAESNTEDREGRYPEKGKVESVCKQWVVHEDGVLAYKLQNEEKDFHYGLNRYNRRTVRDDIPVAKLVQSEEELRQQRDRMEHLMLLKTQAEEDEKMAQSVRKDIDSEEAVYKLQSQLHDEDYARKMQEKEKRRHERWKREQALKKERERLELELARHSEEARLVINRESVGSIREDGQTRHSSDTDNVRVTAGGHIEDDGDFSDFYIPPADHMEEGEKKQLQELQDEELARLLQEQEHKRTKAEVDRGKLKQIEVQDAQLARIIHEQDKLKAKKLKQRKQKSLDEARKQRNNVDAAQRSVSVDEHSVDRRNHEAESPQSYHSNESQSSQQQRQLRNHNSVSSNEDMLEQRLSPASSRSHGRSPPPYHHRPRVEQDRDQPLQTTQSGMLQRDAREVERWLVGQNRTPDDVRGRTQPSPPGSSHSQDSFQEYHRQQSQQTHPKYQREPSPVPFNIAMAIDPTYRPSAQEQRPAPRLIEHQPHIEPPPIDTREYEDEPEEDYDVDDPNWAPVQGQRRSQNDRSKNTQKKPAGKKGSCKQQ